MLRKDRSDTYIHICIYLYIIEFAFPTRALSICLAQIRVQIDVHMYIILAINIYHNKYECIAFG